MSKKKAPAAPAAAPAATGYAGAPAAGAAPATGGAEMQQYAAAMAQQAQTPGSVVGPPPEEMVGTLCGMGFPREMVLNALRAAFNNPDRAMGYLLDGNIPNVAPPAPTPAAPQTGGQWPEGQLGPQLLTKNGMVPTAQALGSAPVVLLYFSAHWCPPCKQFTPMLARAFSALGPNQIQVVFVTGDRDQASFQGYYNQMPWVAIPFGSPPTQMLSAQFQVRGIPSVVALDARTGNPIDINAKQTIGESRFDLASCLCKWGHPPAAAAPAPVAAAPAAPAAPAKKPEPTAVEIDTKVAKDALDRVADQEWQTQETFYATILKVLNNTLQNPTEVKFRSLKKTNATLQSKLFGIADGAAVELLKLGAFEDAEEVVGLPGAPDGRCTSLRDFIQGYAENKNMDRLRKERDERIAAEKKNSKEAKTYGGDENGRMELGGGRRRGGGGG